MVKIFHIKHCSIILSLYKNFNKKQADFLTVGEGFAKINRQDLNIGRAREVTHTTPTTAAEPISLPSVKKKKQKKKG